MKEEEAEETSPLPFLCKKGIESGAREASVVSYNGYKRKCSCSKGVSMAGFLLQQPQLGVTSLLPSSGVWMEQQGRSGASWLQGVCHQSTVNAAVENKLKNYMYICKKKKSSGAQLQSSCLCVLFNTVLGLS